MGLVSFLTARGRSAASQEVNIASAEFKANPFPYYAQLRAEKPVHRMFLATKEYAWLVTRYDDVVTVLKDERFAKDPANALTPAQIGAQRWFRKVFKSLGRNMLNLDPPDHTRLRALVHKAFTPPLIEQMRVRVQRLTEDLLDAVQSRGSMDLIGDYALPLPTTIIAEMMGIPVEDRHSFHHRSNAVMAAAASSWAMVKAVPHAWAFIRYLRKVIQKRRANPGDDLISALIQAREAGDTMSDDELLAMVMLLLVAGHETTVNLIGNGVLALLEHPDQLARLRNDPTLIKPAVEEILRYTNPVDMSTERFAREDVSLGDVTIPRGEMVFAVLGSANRDERHFPNPDALDITREPNKHLAFGLGAHFCLGASLARLEGQIAIGTLLRRCPDLRLAVTPNQLRWRRGLLLRGLQALPLAFGQNGRRIAGPVTSQVASVEA
jgi:cytochrome P450 PksS